MSARTIDPDWPVVGIDAGGRRLDVAWSDGGATLAVANDPEGVATLLAALEARPVRLVVVEASGGVERAVARMAEAAGWPLHRANPRRTRRFAEAIGRQAKTDRLDARMLADYGHRVDPEPRPLPSPETHALGETVTRRRQVQEMIDAEESRLRRVEAAPVREAIVAHLAFLRAQRAALEAELAARIAEDPVWAETAALLRTVPGVGPVVTATLLGLLPELGTLKPGQITALAGLAPHADDSGSRQGERHVGPGRPGVSSVLYEATLSGCRFNPALKRFYARLCANGKHVKEARVACARKLLTILNAIVRDRVPWDETLALRC